MKYLFLIRRISDDQITHRVKSDDPDFRPQIPSGWNLKDNHEVIREEVIESADSKRRKEYQREVDPFFQEAVIDYIAGEPTKMLKLIDDYGKIKLKYPKE